MKIETTPLGPDQVLIILNGRLDIAGAAEIETQFSAVSSHAKAAIVDLTATPFVASIGIRLLLANAKALSRRGGRMIVFGCDPQVEKVLRSTGVDNLIPILPTKEDAIAHAGAGAA